jgi:catechol 2,3-dioxygenase-like lactoylglutathione lyase family enzyme
MEAIRYLINDVDRAVRFYTQHLGFKLDQQMGEEWIPHDGDFCSYLQREQV